MKNTVHKTGGANTLYHDFLSLDRRSRRNMALRILGDQHLLADLYDHFLIRESVEEKGRNVAWESYRRSGTQIAS